MIVKLLGRKIDFKVLENRLKQMWVNKGIIQIIDLGEEYFLVTISSSEDHAFALSEGPWLIFDNYLTMREWHPDFHHSGAPIDKVATWVRVSGLPIEYYDEIF